MIFSGTDCARAREAASADLDGELQELDLRRLRAHLRACADCSIWADHIGVATAQLRAAPSETPLAFSFVQSRRGRNRRVSPALAVAPAVALVASVVVSLSGAQHRSWGGQPTTGTSVGSPDRHLPHNSLAVRKDRPAAHNWVLWPV